MPEGEHPLEQFILDKRRERIDTVLKSRTRSLTVVLDRVHNAHNISAVIRSADAFGIQDIHYLGDHLDLSSGITIGADRWVDVHKYNSAADLLNCLKQDAYEIVVLMPPDKLRGEIPSFAVHNLPFDRNLALVFGNEKEGVGPEIVRAATMSAFIPMNGFVESLNISVAAAITLYCSTLGDRTRKLGETEKAQIKDRWLREEVRGSEAILKRLDTQS
ncbi:MAG: RNA methyltransferase [Bdellovibrionales bacterium]|nr:RNA methyltransferase [Bdellovibrionales bacterium]